MLEKEKNSRAAIEFINTDMFVPEDHLLRKIDNAADFSRIYEIVSDLYCHDNGRPSVDPVVLFKIVLIQHLYGLPSLRRTSEEIQMNIAYRWFLGYTLNENTPHFSTVSYNFKHRFTEEVIEEVFGWILTEIEKAGYLSPEAIFVDGTHIKANANIRKAIKKEIPQAAKRYEEELRREISEDRAKHGKKPIDFDDDDKNGGTPVKEVTQSVTDPESGVFHKGEHKKCFAYEAHTACDKHGFILGTVVTPGNVHDSVAFDDVYDSVTERFPEIQVIAADSAYKTPWICKRIIDDGRIPSMPYVRPKTKDGGHEWWKYVYDEYYDCILCPEYRALHYATTNRHGYREYKSRSYICEKCPTIHLCTENAKHEKTVAQHIWNNYVELAEDYRHTPEIKEVYEKRKETIERCFGDAKEKYGMRYTQYRGLAQVTKWVKLKFAAMNLKKLALWKAKKPSDGLTFQHFSQYLAFLFPIFKKAVSASC